MTCSMTSLSTDQIFQEIRDSQAMRGIKRPRSAGYCRPPVIAAAAARESYLSMNFRTNNRTRTTATRSRSSAALVLSTTILAAAFGGSSLLRQSRFDGRHARMLSSVEGDSNGRTQQEQAQIDAFYAKYFAGGSPKEAQVTTAATSDGPIEETEKSGGDTFIPLAKPDMASNEQPGQKSVVDPASASVIDTSSAMAQENKVDTVDASAVKSDDHPTEADPFSSTPFCSPIIASDLFTTSTSITTPPQYTYKCGESADIPMPLTEYSASSKTQYDDWILLVQILNRMATKFGERVEAERRLELPLPTASLRGAEMTSSDNAATTRKRPMIFLGDGIFEAYLGTRYGHPSVSSEREDIMATFAATFSTPKYAPLVQSIEGDMTQHLLYRLAHNGALNPGYVTDPTAIYVVLIGTANLSAGHLPQETARGILAVVQQLMDRVAGRVLLLQPLPRGDAATSLTALCPAPFGGPRCDKNGKALPAYKPGLEKVRYALENAMATLTHRYPDRIHLLQRCAQAFWPTAEGRSRGEEVNYELFEDDGWHPNNRGHEAIGRCLLDCIEDGRC